MRVTRAGLKGHMQFRRSHYAFDHEGKYFLNIRVSHFLPFSAAFLAMLAMWLFMNEILGRVYYRPVTQIPDLFHFFPRAFDLSIAVRGRESKKVKERECSICLFSEGLRAEGVVCYTDFKDP